VTFVDAVRREELPAYLRGVDILVLPSLTTPAWKEQFGRVLVEAMACGIPVVGSDSGTIPEVIGDAGIVFASGSSEDLAGKLLPLVKNPAMRDEYGMRGRTRVMNNFSDERIAERLYTFLLSCQMGADANPARAVVLP